MSNILDKIIDVSGGRGGNSHLIIGDKKSSIIDCGMAYCSSELIRNIKNVLGHERNLDFILLSHSHYDHAGSIPYLIKEWPHVKVLAAEHAYDIFQRPNALKLIKELSKNAGKYYGFDKIIEYDDKLMKVHEIISEGNIIDLGGISIKVIETPGHTKCSLSFLVNDLVLFTSETTGVYSKSGGVHTSIINSYNDAMKSFEKCQATNAKYIIASHQGLISEDVMSEFWPKCLKAAIESKEFVMQLYKDGYNENQIYEEYKTKFFNDELKSQQPDIAFEINNRAMIKTYISGK